MKSLNLSTFFLSLSLSQSSFRVFNTKYSEWMELFVDGFCIWFRSSSTKMLLVHREDMKTNFNPMLKPCVKIGTGSVVQLFVALFLREQLINRCRFGYAICKSLAKAHFANMHGSNKATKGALTFSYQQPTTEHLRKFLIFISNSPLLENGKWRFTVEVRLNNKY